MSVATASLFFLGRHFGGNKEIDTKAKLHRLAKARLDLRA